MIQHWFTVIDVAKDLGVDLSSREAWELGALIRDLYERLHGQLPPKALRPKTNGEGSHCFAIYPAEFRPKIEQAILAIPRTRAAQQDLFSAEKAL